MAHTSNIDHIQTIPYFKAYENFKIPYKLGPFDSDGVPMFDPANLKLKGEISYHPITIIQYGLANYNLWIKNRKTANKKTFLICADWICQNYTYQNKNDSAIYYYHFDLKNPPVKAPWFSGMAQGQALSVLIRAFLETRNEKYLLTSRKVSNSFLSTIENNGCISHFKGNTFIQEIAHNPKLYILNGALYGLIGIMEYKHIDESVDFNTKDFVEGIKSLLPEFNLGFWSRYSIGMRFNLADLYYQKVHAQQLQYLGKMLNDDELIFYGRKFNRQLEKYGSIIKPLLFLSLNINRAFRLIGLGSLLYKYKH